MQGRSRRSGSDPGARPQGGRRAELALAALAAALAVTLYLPALSSGFVYDDTSQIVENPMIQDPGLLGRALVSDVWSFRGGSASASNYWRPSFIVWIAALHRLFGLTPAPWHGASILLHATVTVLALALLRRLGSSLPVAGGAALLFAAHPVHTESVAWISGAPDLLLAAGLLGSLLFLLSALRHRSWWRWAGSLGCYAFALGAKEAAVTFPAIVFAVAVTDAGDWPARGGRRRAVVAAAPYAVLAVLYFVARHAVLGRAMPAGPASVRPATLLASIPEVVAFYLRQIVWPHPLGPVYPLRANDRLGLANFLAPLALVAAVGLWMWLGARRERVAAVGLALFAAPLAPALALFVFHPERMVQDRYLYLPLLGALMTVLPALARRLGGSDRLGRAGADRMVFALAAVACLPLGIATVRYSRAWSDDLKLWQAGTRSDPGSAFAHMMLGGKLAAAGRGGEALAAFDRSLAIRPDPQAYLGRAEALLTLRRYPEAESTLSRLLATDRRDTSFDRFKAYERLAQAAAAQGHFADAAAVLRTARGQFPERRAEITQVLAAVLYQTGNRAEGLAELEAVRTELDRETSPRARMVLYWLGILYAEAGRTSEARAATERYLAVTRGMEDPPTRRTRAFALELLERLGDRGD